MLIFFVCAAQIFPQHKFEGKIFNASNGEPIEGAYVYLPEENKYSVTDAVGKFSFSDLHLDVVELSIQHLAFHKTNIRVNTKSKEAAGLKIYLQPISIELNEVVISDEKNKYFIEGLEQSIDKVSGKELSKDLSATLASTLKNQTGLSLRTMGPAPARPVIRGLGGNRIFISEDNNATNDLSATSPDHAVTTEPFTIETIEIIRGPKQLIHNSSAMGGTINIVREEILHHIPDHIHGFAGAYGESMNKGFLSGGVFEIPVSSFAFRIEGTKRNASNASTPIGELMNTEMSSTNYSTSASYIFDNGYFGFAMREFSSDYGIPGGFVGGHPKGVDIALLRRLFSAKGKFVLPFSSVPSLEINFARTYFNQKEFESSGLIGAEFVTRDFESQINFNTEEIFFFNEGSLGLSYKNRDFRIGGFVFTPNAITDEAALYFYQKYLNENNLAEVSGRFAFAKITPEKNSPDKNFTSISFSASYLRRFAKLYSAGLQINYSNRAPSLEELFSQGPHLAAYTYEKGNGSLELENGLGFELNNFFSLENADIRATFFYNYFSNYITPQNTGKINFATLLPIFESTGVEAALTGYEFELDYKPFQNFALNFSSHFVRGKIEPGSENLPQIPPHAFFMDAKYIFDSWNVGVEINSALAQNRTGQFEERTAGYAIANMYLQKNFLFIEWAHIISLTWENIFNKEYRNHLSRIKSIAPESGRSLRAIYKIYF